MVKLMSFIEIEGSTLRGIFERRLTRFTALVRIDGKIVSCFLPNPGRLRELLVSGARVILRDCGSASKRKTAYDIIGVYRGEIAVSVDSRIPNKLVFQALKNGELPEFRGYSQVKPEYIHGRERFDFLLYGGPTSKPCLLEVKSCTLVRDGVAMFPDAPTERGTRHVLRLAKALNEGFRAAILFVIQRNDAEIFMPNDEIDPKFGLALREAIKQGVEVYAYSSFISSKRIILDGKVKVKL
jgi:sugar fermentation stimulation protein A